MNMSEKQSKKPLSDIKVLEMGSLIAGPFAARLMADFGAEVIKVEPPGAGDPLRKWRMMHEGTSLWWYIQSRNKKCITLDLRQRKGQEIIRKLCEEVDMIIENFRPGTLEKWQIGYEDLKKINPKLIMVRISGYGQDGPYRNKPGFGSVGEALGGLRHVTGFPDRPPTRVGVSLGDSVSSLYAVFGAMMALYHRDVRGGDGQYIDIALYESIFSLMESAVSEYDFFGFIRERTGSALPGIAPSNTYRCKDGKYIVIGANGDAIFKRLMAAIGREDLAGDSRCASNEGRAAHAEQLDRAIEAWTNQNDLQDALRMLESFDVPSGPIYSAEDMCRDPHFQERKMIEQIDVEGLGRLKVPGIVPKMSDTPGGIEWAGPSLGEHNDEIYRKRLGLSEQVYRQLTSEGII